MMSHDQLAIGIFGALAPAFGMVFRQMHKMRKHLEKIANAKAKFEIEHEMLVDMYCQTKGINRGDLPTRHTNGALKSE